MIDYPDADNLYEELCQLVALGPRFHGTSGEESAAAFIDERLSRVGASVSTQAVTTAAWHPQGATELVVTSPREWDIECWPLLWSAGSDGIIEGTIRPQGKEGFWDNSFVWTKFVVLADDQPVAYISSRDDGPAAPQPLPAGSAVALPHVAIGYVDGRRISEWIGDGVAVRVRIRVGVERSDVAVGHNLKLTLAGSDTGGGEAIVCGHYDTFWNTVGAYDNGSGTIALLELARRWVDRTPRRTVHVIFFAAEEWHLAGSRSLVASMNPEQRSRVDLVLNLDGLGRGDLLECSVGPETFEHGLTSSIERFARDRPGLSVTSRFPPLMGTDHAPFYAAGIPSAHFTFNDWRLLHRPEDVPNRNSARNVAWSVSLVEHLVEILDRPERSPLHDIL